MTNDEIVRIIQEQHAIRVQRFQVGVHRNDATESQVHDMLHLNDYLADQRI
ncbi:hypothetical protein QNA24_29940 [Rhodococcus qingshengii]|uniref:hypothetical protein n=1 Tax=Rhodococcus TaxID=1827 RepID=UPI001E53FB7E|nr:MULTISPECIES: hypothetical protein [Rhodococcus]MCD2099591.1 hypothetical protein [Rhodococcus rhodochrous]MCD2123959.1 hypothetical protein [Rhodococcus rhodochrous]MCQ4136610.1 hypothetical protein [Rhodococcus rhodochrous]MDJ0490605.1 hypothetical protein [Rhodococcus qingshengii]